MSPIEKPPDKPKEYVDYISTVKNLKAIYSKPKITTDSSGSPIFGKEYTIWQAEPLIFDSPWLSTAPILIVDSNDLINKDKAHWDSLKLEHYKGDFNKIWKELPWDTKKKITKIAEKWFPEVPTGHPTLFSPKLQSFAEIVVFSVIPGHKEAEQCQ